MSELKFFLKSPKKYFHQTPRILTSWRRGWTTCLRARPGSSPTWGNTCTRSRRRRRGRGKRRRDRNRFKPKTKSIQIIVYAGMHLKNLVQWGIGQLWHPLNSALNHQVKIKHQIGLFGEDKIYKYVRVSQQWFYLCVDQNSKTCYIAYKRGLHNKEFNSWTFKTYFSSKSTGNSDSKACNDNKQQMTLLSKQWVSTIIDYKAM